MATGVVVWSQTAATNASADGNANWAEGMAPSQINDSARAIMASVAKWRDDLNATLLASGVSTAITVTTNQVEASLTAGYEVTWTTTFNCGAPVTLNVDSLGAKPLRRAPGVALLADSLKGGVPFRASYFASNGGEWLIQGWRSPLVVTQVLSTSGTYTPTANMAYVRVQAVGGGGGGGNANAGAYRSGAGGSGGTYSESILSATQITSSQTVTIGAGGVGGTAVSSATDGGATSLGSLVTAPGGKGAAGGGSFVRGAIAPSSGTAQWCILGQPGGSSFNTSTSGELVWSGKGGNSALGFGGAATGRNNNSTGDDGGNYGGGGSGAATYNAGAATGGSGGSGVIIVTEYL